MPSDGGAPPQPVLPQPIMADQALGPLVSTRPLIQMQGLAKRYGGGSAVFAGLDLSIHRGEFVCIVGHSGCGKTTVLNILAGLETPTEGVVLVDGRQITGPGLDRAVIFQGHALMPWMTALENVAFAVKSRWPAWSRARVRDHALGHLRRVGLGAAMDKRPAQLSGGMKQRVGIARALSIEPAMLLMDEPFSALDALTRGTLQDEVLRLCAEVGQTVFMITHDVDEAVLLADRIVLMTNGPGARIAEIVVNTLPRARHRAELHHLPGYYPLRNHIVDFLVERAAAPVAAPLGPAVVRTL
ncbi:MAG TPA: ABC transporter ATP-binding protein [Stellaceae bacterium]|nr:ABC transporter ATP-binding protein [Stellaceae bacterium]